MNKKQCVIGIDTSNYTTSVALCDLEGNILHNGKKLLPVEAGACGLRQSDALFHHTRQLPELMAEVSPFLKEWEPVAVGVSDKPRQAEGSYMPCFLAGVSSAVSIATAMQIPLYRFAHQQGHIQAACYSAGVPDLPDSAPFIAFHVSGGTTECVLVKNERMDTEILCATGDLHAGQLIDRIGVMLGLSFPCGRELEQLALSFDGALPQIKTSVKDGTCHFSGIQNQAEALYKAGHSKEEISAFVLAVIGKTLVKMTDYADRRVGHLPIVYAGGVMSDGILQNMLKKRKDTYFATPAFSADNAAGIALLARKELCRR